MAAINAAFATYRMVLFTPCIAGPARLFMPIQIKVELVETN